MSTVLFYTLHVVTDYTILVYSRENRILTQLLLLTHIVVTCL